jgi:hisZ_biosyn_reg: ATP phosphoribosyltransferase, regulatory subunit
LPRKKKPVRRFIA